MSQSPRARPGARTDLGAGLEIYTRDLGCSGEVVAMRLAGGVACGWWWSHCRWSVVEYTSPHSPKAVFEPSYSSQPHVAARVVMCADLLGSSAGGLWPAARVGAAASQPSRPGPRTGRKAAARGPPYLGHPDEVAPADGPSSPLRHAAAPAGPTPEGGGSFMSGHVRFLVRRMSVGCP